MQILHVSITQTMGGLQHIKFSVFSGIRIGHQAALYVRIFNIFSHISFTIIPPTSKEMQSGQEIIYSVGDTSSAAPLSFVRLPFVEINPAVSIKLTSSRATLYPSYSPSLSAERVNCELKEFKSNQIRFLSRPLSDCARHNTEKKLARGLFPQKPP